MARKTKIIRKYYKKARWSSNIKSIENETILIPSGKQSASITLCYNPNQVDNTVSQIYTIKNIEFNFEIEGASSGSPDSLESICGYIMFVPQGMSVGNDYAQLHPEYIMAMRFYGSPDQDTPYRNPLRIKTRLSRKLNTGDSIIFYITTVNGSTTSHNMRINGLLRWWTKAN